MWWNCLSNVVLSWISKARYNLSNFPTIGILHSVRQVLSLPLPLSLSLLLSLSLSLSLSLMVFHHSSSFPQNGLTAFAVAKAHDQQAVCDLLEKYGSKEMKEKIEEMMEKTVQVDL